MYDDALMPPQTCFVCGLHGRGVHAMGGMAAQIPIKDDPARNEAALTKVRSTRTVMDTGQVRHGLG